MASLAESRDFGGEKAWRRQQITDDVFENYPIDESYGIHMGLGNRM